MLLFDQYFFNMDISITVSPQSQNLNHVYKTSMWRVSQNVYIGPSSYLMEKKGNVLILFIDSFSTFHKIKSKTYIKNLRHRSLHIYVNNDM